MSIGEDRVRTKFNPSANSQVDQIKQATASLIDVCEGLKSEEGKINSSEKVRCAALAMTAYEEAAMWAVKAATV